MGAIQTNVTGDTGQELALVNAAREGDMHAFEQLIQKYDRNVFRIAQHITQNREDAEDVVQDAFCRLAEVQRRRSDVVTLPYLMTMVRNECYSRLRRRRRSPFVHEKPLLEPVAGGTGSEERLILEGALRALSPEQREVIYLKVYEGLTFAEIGECCGISLNTAASRYRYAIDALRTRLIEDRSRT
jgi:RNA polymerase sigma-70 factor (ECF subfamily)